MDKVYMLSLFISLLRASNPVNPVNPVNHNKVLRRSLVLLSSRKCNNDLQDYEDSHDFRASTIRLIQP